MALGRRNQEQQPSFWIAVDDLPRSEGHVFYGKLNRLLREAGFDEFAERLCEPYYHDTMGRPGIPPGVYFRMLLVGYFEGLGSQRGIVRRDVEDLLSQRNGTDRGRTKYKNSSALFFLPPCPPCLRGKPPCNRASVSLLSA